jgi:hypothetical protein
VTGVHQMWRGTKHAVAHALHTIVTANDDRAHGRCADQLTLARHRDVITGTQRPTQCWPRLGLAPARTLTQAREVAYARIMATSRQTAGHPSSRDLGMDSTLVWRESLDHNKHTPSTRGPGSRFMATQG